MEKKKSDNWLTAIAWYVDSKSCLSTAEIQLKNFMQKSCLKIMLQDTRISSDISYMKLKCAR